ncbi:MAG: hypothetical protein WAU84_01475 [Thermoguttaceae bacterium]
MKSIRRWDDLCAHGIVPLTGEACGLSYRILCDVTARGKKTLEKALGVAQLGLQDNWNHGSADGAHVGSIMLAPELLPFIGVFALLEAGCREVWLTKSRQVVGIEADDPPDRVDAFDHYCGDEMLRRFAYAGTAGDRNQHMMTGRVV